MDRRDRPRPAPLGESLGQFPKRPMDRLEGISFPLEAPMQPPIPPI